MRIQKKMIGVMTVVMVLTVSSDIFSHCEIPCGIYDDAMRINMMKEHIKTIQKSMIEIKQLQEADEINQNQLVRWIVNKEEHADQFSEIVTQYFMTQRIKPVDPSRGKDYQAYINQLTLLHELMITSMKCKQTIDLENVDKLKKTLSAFNDAYFGKDSSQ